MKEKTSKTLSVLYNISDNFPKDIGVLYYNEEFHSFIDKYGGKLSQKERKAVLKSLENDYSFFKKIIDRAIEKVKPTEDDEKILRESFNLQPNLKWGKDKKFHLSYPFFEDVWRKLLAKWIFYVWNGDIKVKRCEAEGCKRIFIPYPNAPVEQKYCSDKCKNRIAKRRYRKKKERLSDP